MRATNNGNGSLEDWLWDAACMIRGPVDAPKFKDFILPLIFLKRLSDVFDDEMARLAEQFGGLRTALTLAEEDHGLVSFFVPEVARWEPIATTTTGLGDRLTDAMRALARDNPRLAGVTDVIDFNATAAGQRIVTDQQLAALVDKLGKHRLGLRDVEPDILGRAYEYLLRKFAEGQGQSAGEFYTPRPVATLMARLLDPEPGMTVYDPCCGSGGLLIKCHLRLLETHGVETGGHRYLPGHVAPLRLFGQEINATTYAMAKMNAFIHGMDADIRLGDTMHRPAFLSPDGKLQRFDLVTANPMWNQDFPLSTYENDGHGRFTFGIPPASSADWGWIQHMYASLADNGRMAVVLDTGAVSRGSGGQGSNRERDIRKALVEQDAVEAVFLLPDNMFYNTSAPAIILFLNKAKRRPGEVLLVSASKQFTKGRPKNELTEEHIALIAGMYRDWEDREGLSARVPAVQVAANDYNLSPSRYVSASGEEAVLSLEEAVVLLREAEEEQTVADRALSEVLANLGFGR